MARPKKYDIKGEEVEKLAGFGCTNIEIASFYGCSSDLIEKSYSEYITKGRKKGKIRLLQLMFKSAESGNTTMQIWLSKQYLGMTDKQDITTTELPKGFETRRIK